MKNKFLKKSFTLIELIVVIVVIGMLSAIVIPNISSMKQEAEAKSIMADAKNIQTAVDVFMLKNDGRTPTKDIPTFGDPQVIETYAMKPDYLRNLPKERKVKFWLDEDFKVWASLVDAPQQVDYAEGRVRWNTVEGAVEYKIYRSSSKVVSSLKSAARLQLIDTIQPIDSNRQFRELPALSEGTYLVSAIDRYDFESPMTKIGSTYKGYGDGPDKDFFVGGTVGDTVKNKNPQAVIGFEPSMGIDTNTSIVWSHAESTDPDGHALTVVEWKLNGEVVGTMPERLPEGTNLVEMRVQDEMGSWSPWESQSISVARGATTPTVISTSRLFAKTTYNTADVKILKNGDLIDVLYYPSVCCINNTLFRESFDKDGRQVSLSSVKGFTGSKNNLAISNIDEDGNIFMITEDAIIYMVKPDGTTSIFGYYQGQLTTDTYKKVYKLAIEIEGDRIYIGYNNKTSLSSPYLAIIDKKSKQLISNSRGMDGYMSNTRISNVVVTKDHVYTSALDGHEDSNLSSIYVIKWDKITGKMIKGYTFPKSPDIQLLGPTLFKDALGGIWFSEATRFQKDQPIRMKRVNTDKMDGVESVVHFPDLGMYRAYSVITQEDKSLRIFGLNGQNQIFVSEFR